MTKAPKPETPILPANQPLRVNILRLAFLLLLPLILFTGSGWAGNRAMFDLLVLLGILTVFAAVLGRFWSILYIGGRKNQTVMQDGPYSICRHPLYLFSTLGATGLGLMLGSISVAVIIGTVAFVILNATAANEERFLRNTFGPAYVEYAARVPRIAPKFSLFRTEPDVTFNIATLRENFFDALVFIGFIPLAMVLNLAKDSGWLPVWPPVWLLY